MTGAKLPGLAAFLAAISVLACATAHADTAATLLDKPLKIVRQPLARDPENPQAKAELACFYFPRFVVKQIDLGEVDAEQLSIIPRADHSPAGEPVCRKQNAPNEKIVSADDFTGYFNGVKGAYVFFDAGDGWNDGLGFAVFTGDATKIVEDAAKKWSAVALTPSGLSMRYMRVFAAKCSLQVNAKACWQQIEHDTGLSGTPPNCTAAYQQEQKRVPKFAKQTLSDPTIIDYEAELTITGRAYKIAPVTGKAIACRPAE